MERFLFLTDLDDTLLTSDKIVSPYTKEILKKYSERGNIFALCSGRDINSTRLVYKELGLNLPGSYAIAYNGGQIFDIDTNETVFRTGIRRECVAEIFELAREYDIHVQTYNDTHIIAREENECTSFYKRVIKTPLLAGPDFMNHLNVPPCKVICIELHDHEKQERFKEAAEKAFGDELSLMYSSDYYLELIPKESGKGASLLKLCEILGIPRENSIAAGDAGNDLSMIKAAGTGIAMINGMNEVKAAADVITETDNNHDGLALALKRILDL